MASLHVRKPFIYLLAFLAAMMLSSLLFVVIVVQGVRIPYAAYELLYILVGIALAVPIAVELWKGRARWADFGQKEARVKDTMVRIGKKIGLYVLGVVVCVILLSFLRNSYLLKQVIAYNENNEFITRWIFVFIDSLARGYPSYIFSLTFPLYILLAK